MATVAQLINDLAKVRRAKDIWRERLARLDTIEARLMSELASETEEKVQKERDALPDVSNADINGIIQRYK